MPDPSTGLFSVESVKELTAYGALLVILGYSAYRIPKVIDRMLETFKSEMAEERKRCDQQMTDRDERYDKIVDVLDRLERKS